MLISVLSHFVSCLIGQVSWSHCHVSDNSSHIDCLEHKGSISQNQNFSGNDFKDFASFNSCFYHLDIAFVKRFLHHWNRLHQVFLLVYSLITFIGFGSQEGWITTDIKTYITNSKTVSTHCLLYTSPSPRD